MRYVRININGVCSDWIKMDNLKLDNLIRTAKEVSNQTQNWQLEYTEI